MNKDSLRSEYDSKQKLFKRIKDTALFKLSQGISGKKMKIHSLDGRIKSFDSFYEKIKRKKIQNPFKEIDDIVGLRIICLFLDDIQKLRNILKNIFEIIKEDNIIDNSEPHVFGYLGTQFKVKYKDANPTDVYNIPFEVQIRTIAQDVWASISHHLDYKKEYGIPDHLKRNFYALSGLFYVADTQFKKLRDEHFKNIVSK